MSTVLITGSNRGLGLEWVRQFAADGWQVMATCRHPQEAHALHELADPQKNVRILRLDIAKTDEINAVAVELRDTAIDILVNNAGVYLEKYWDTRLSRRRISYEDWEYTFRVNTLGPVRVTEALMDHVARSLKRLVVVTSTHMASIADIAQPGAYYYRSSKAALNAAMEGITLELEEAGIGLLLMHPGHVKTRMGGGGTSLMPRESVRGMRRLAEDFKMGHSGCFFRYDGQELPW